MTNYFFAIVEMIIFNKLIWYKISSVLEKKVKTKIYLVIEMMLSGKSNTNLHTSESMNVENNRNIRLYMKVVNNLKITKLNSNSIK